MELRQIHESLRDGEQRDGYLSHVPLSSPFQPGYWGSFKGCLQFGDPVSIQSIICVQYSETHLVWRLWEQCIRTGKTTWPLWGTRSAPGGWPAQAGSLHTQKGTCWFNVLFLLNKGPTELLFFLRTANSQFILIVSHCLPSNPQGNTFPRQVVAAWSEAHGTSENTEFNISKSYALKLKKKKGKRKVPCLLQF